MTPRRRVPTWFKIGAVLTGAGVMVPGIPYMRQLLAQDGYSHADTGTLAVLACVMGTVFIAVVLISAAWIVIRLRRSPRHAAGRGPLGPPGPRDWKPPNPGA